MDTLFCGRFSFKGSGAFDHHGVRGHHKRFTIGCRYVDIIDSVIKRCTACNDNSRSQDSTTAYNCSFVYSGTATNKGVILDDVDVITHMEHDGKGTYIPAKIKDGTVAANAGSLATLEELGAIFRHIDAMMTQMAESLYDGDVAAMPLKGKKYDGCAYCKYQSVCLREEDDPCREAEDKSAEEVYRELMGEEDDHGEKLDGTSA